MLPPPDDQVGAKPGRCVRIEIALIDVLDRVAARLGLQRARRVIIPLPIGLKIAGSVVRNGFVGRLAVSVVCTPAVALPVYCNWRKGRLSES